MAENTNALEARVAALEELINNDLLPAIQRLENANPEKPAEKKVEKPVLKGTPFTVNKERYALKYLSFQLDSKTYTEQDVLDDPELQARLVKEFPGLLNKL